MRRNRITLALLGLGIALPVLSYGAYQPGGTANNAGSSTDGVASAKQFGNSFLNNILNSSNKPAWLTRTDITYDIQNKNTPISGLETIQPLYESNWSTLFWQGRITYNSGDGTGNLGAGYRYLTDNRQMMFGVNAFYDETFHYQHKRVGLGGEFFTPYITLRANAYDAISGRKLVDLTAGVATYERALSGFDASIETPVPRIPWMRFTAGGYHWAGHAASNVNGGQAGLRVFPARQLELDIGVADDNNLHGQGYFKLNYYFGSPAFIEHSAMTSSLVSGFTAQNLEDMRLQKVIRHNDIAIEKTSSNTSNGIIIARGD